MKGKNFTTNDTYHVYIGKMGTKGVGGVKVDTIRHQCHRHIHRHFLSACIPEDRNPAGDPIPEPDYRLLCLRLVRKPSDRCHQPITHNNPHHNPCSSPGVGYPPNGKGTIPSVVVCSGHQRMTVSRSRAPISPPMILTMFIWANLAPKQLVESRSAPRPPAELAPSPPPMIFPPACKEKPSSPSDLKAQPLVITAYDWFTNNKT